MNGVNLAKDPAAAYLAGVRAALRDLPEPEVAEILDDVSAHLAELRGELGPDVDLTARLGDPAAYAAELRAAAGYPEAPAQVDSASGQTTARLALVALVAATALGGLAGLGFFSGAVLFLPVAAVVTLFAVPALSGSGPHVESVAALPVVRRLIASRPDPDAVSGRLAGFAASLQPAWWLLRALLAALLVGAIVLGGVTWGAPVVILAAVFALVSVWLGYRSRADRRWLWVVVPLNAFAAALVLTGFPAWAGYTSYPDATTPATPAPGVEGPSAYFPGLWQDALYQITDIRPFDADGNALTGVYLRDQEGRPIDTGDECTGYGGYGRINAPRTYPRSESVYDETTGTCTSAPSGSSAGAEPPPESPTGATGTEVPPPPAEASPTDQAPPPR